MGQYGNYGFNHFNENKNFINYNNCKPPKKKRKIWSILSGILVIVLALGIVCATFGFIILTDNKLGNEIREKYNISYKIETNNNKNDDNSSYQAFLDNNDKEYKEYEENNPHNDYYADNSLIEQQDEIINSGNIPTKTPIETTNDMQIITTDGSGKIKENIVQGDRNPTPIPTQTTTPIPTNEVATTPIPTVITPIITPVPAVVTPITIKPTTVVTPVPETTTPIVTQTPSTPIPTQVTTPIPTQVVTPTPAQETYTINQNAYNNAEQTANEYSDVTSALLTEINNVRNNNGLSPLTIDSTLNKMAGYRAYDMGENQYFSHSYNDVSQLRVVMYAYNRMSIRHYENLGKAANVDQNQVAAKIVSGWCDSTSHYGVLTNGNLTTIGIAVHKDYQGTWYIATIYS